LTSNLIYFFSIAIFFGSNTLRAQENEQAHEGTWSYETDSAQPDASDILAPMVSFIIPGAGQWMRGQVLSGTLYSGVALAGLSYAEHSGTEIGHQKKIDDTEISQKGFAQRKYMLGLQTYQASGGMSLYHTFRSAVWQRQKFGQYAFLTRSETPLELMKAPIEFQYLTRPTTYIPLAIGGMASWYLASHPPKGYTKSRLRREDPMFATAFSFNAGTHEEAMFRGWLMPVMHDSGLTRQMGQCHAGHPICPGALGHNKYTFAAVFPWPPFGARDTKKSMDSVRGCIYPRLVGHHCVSEQLFL